MRIWVVGTSVSVIKYGYVGILAQIAAPVPVINISIGDQTSIMGLIRILMHIDKIDSGDLVVWEYPLLDILLVGFFDQSDMLSAARQAWQHVQSRGARIVVLVSVPKRNLEEPSKQEQTIFKEAASMGISVITTRDVFVSKGLRPDEQEAEYSDDRHYTQTSFIHEAIARMLLRAADAHCSIVRLSSVPASGWKWIAASDLFHKDDCELVEVKNSFFSVPAVRPRMNRKAPLPKSSRLICVAVATTRESGCIWCGHSLCAPASTRLAENSRLPMMFRTTRIPCVRPELATIEVAPTHSFATRSWADYGLVHVTEAAPVEIAGILVE
jgi:hypothetical protein